MSYKDITESTLHLFECINISDDVNKDMRIIYDFKIKCYGKSYHLWILFLAVPSLIIFVFIFPLSVICYLFL